VIKHVGHGGILPKRQEPGKYKDPDYPYKYIEEKF